MNATILLFTLLPLAYGGQVASVDLSKEKVPPHLSGTRSVRGGGLLGGARGAPAPPPIRLVLTRIIPRSTGVSTHYAVEVVMTNTGDAPVSIPVGTDTDSLLDARHQGRSTLVFSSALASSGKRLVQSGATSASNSDRPESSALLQPGDSVVFLLPVGIWPPDKAPTEEISVCVHQERKVVDGGTDWTEMAGPEIRSVNSLPLPRGSAPAPGR